MNDDLLIAYSVGCAFFARVLRPGLDTDLLRRCAQDGVFQSWPLPAGGDAAAAATLVADTLAGLDGQGLVGIEEDNTALFIGPDSPIPLWESVWTTQERLLFDACTTAVEADFARFGFAIPDAGREPADHLAYELAFLAALLVRAGELGQTGAHDEARRHLAAASAFLHDHLGRWAGNCLRTIADRATTDFYRGVARLGAATLAGLAADLTAAEPGTDAAQGPGRRGAPATEHN